MPFDLDVRDRDYRDDAAREARREARRRLEAAIAARHAKGRTERPEDGFEIGRDAVGGEK